MPTEPKYPVALVTDDGEMKVFISFNELAQTVEEPEIASALLIDSSGRGFRLEVTGGQSMIGKLLTAIGAPHRVCAVPFCGEIAPEVMAAGRSALTSSQSRAEDIGL